MCGIKDEIKKRKKSSKREKGKGEKGGKKKLKPGPWHAGSEI